MRKYYHNTTYRNILLTSCGFRHTVYFLLYALNFCMGSNSPQWSRNSGFSSSLSYLLNSNFYRWINALLAQVSIGHLTFKPTINHKPLRATKCPWKWNLFVFSYNVFVFLCENETIHYEAVEWGYGGRWPIMLAHFNKMNTLLLFYRKMGNTLFLEQDEYIGVVFRKDEKYFISLIARWARSYHFSPKRKKYRFWVFLFIFLYISSLFQTLSKMCEAFDGSAVSTLRATSADSAFSQAAQKT